MDTLIQYNKWRKIFSSKDGAAFCMEEASIIKDNLSEDIDKIILPSHIHKSEVSSIKERESDYKYSTLYTVYIDTFTHFGRTDPVFYNGILNLSLSINRSDAKAILMFFDHSGILVKRNVSYLYEKLKNENQYFEQIYNTPREKLEALAEVYHQELWNDVHSVTTTASDELLRFSEI